MLRFRREGPGQSGRLYNTSGAALRLHKLEGEERDEALANLRMCFSALKIDPQGELFAPTEDQVRFN